MEKINLIGKEGQHGSDLLERGIFKGIKIDNKSQQSGSIVPIDCTSKVLREVNRGGEIINFSGIMSTNPIEMSGEINNMHFLFGTAGKENLKVAVSVGNSGLSRYHGTNNLKFQEFMNINYRNNPRGAG